MGFMFTAVLNQDVPAAVKGIKSGFHSSLLAHPAEKHLQIKHDVQEMYRFKDFVNLPVTFASPITKGEICHKFKH